jgi:hypothetical protein
VGEVVRHRVVDRGIGIESLLGRGEVDAIRQLEQMFAASIETDEELAGNVRGMVRGFGS